MLFTLKRVAAACIAVLVMAPLAQAGGYRLLNLDGSLVKWGAPQFGAGASISYAFAMSAMRFDKARNCAGLVPLDGLAAHSHVTQQQIRQEADAAFAAWAKVTGLRFSLTTDIAKADILIGAQAKPVGRAFTNIELDTAEQVEKAMAGPAIKTAPPKKPEALRAIRQALICLNPDQPWKIGFDGRLGVYDLRYTLMHEIGHAIGLDHPGATGALMGFRYDEKRSGLAPADIEAARKLYGTRDLTVSQSLSSSARH
ncbi:MAG: matrixin family metalloprotease [Parvibaculaceae bacterium]